VLWDSSGITTTDIETGSVLNHIIVYGYNFTPLTDCERQKPSVLMIFDQRAQRGFNLYTMGIPDPACLLKGDNDTQASSYAIIYM
jgi:hypothetical protein